MIPWFWTIEGRTNPDNKDLWVKAVSHFQEIADHARDVGIAISLELYEGTYLGDCDSAVAFLQDIGRDNVGLNPDLGNLIRAQVPIEPWEAMAVKVLPFANYWHVKNYARAENPREGIYLTTPTPMASGLINYRLAIAYGIAAGFRGPFLCENYGGDGLAVSAENARYIRGIPGGHSVLRVGHRRSPPLKVPAPFGAHKSRTAGSSNPRPAALALYRVGNRRGRPRPGRPAGRRPWTCRSRRHRRAGRSTGRGTRRRAGPRRGSQVVAYSSEDSFLLGQYPTDCHLGDAVDQGLELGIGEYPGASARALVGRDELGESPRRVPPRGGEGLRCPGLCHGSTSPTRCSGGARPSAPER